MYKELFILAIGIILGMVLEYYKVRSKIGDRYNINKPKQRGNANRMQIDQKNIRADNKPKKRIFVRLISKLKNRKK